MADRATTSFRLSARAREILTAFSARWGITQTAVIEIALRQMAGEPPLLEDRHADDDQPDSPGE